MKIPALLLASLFTVSVSAQSAKPVKKTQKKITNKATKTKAPQAIKSQPIAKKDTIRGHRICVACGMG